MNRFKHGWLQGILLLLQILFFISVIAGYTNWFREGADLIRAVFAVMLFIWAVVLLLPIHLFCLIRLLIKRRSRVDSGLLIASTISFGLFILISNFVVFGQLYPSLEGRVGASYKHEFISSDGSTFQYQVELVNPFLESHKERLVVYGPQKTKTINMRLREKPGPYSIGPQDIKIEQHGTNLLLKSYLDINTHFVLFDYHSGAVISNWVER